MFPLKISLASDKKKEEFVKEIVIKYSEQVQWNITITNLYITKSWV